MGNLNNTQDIRALVADEGARKERSMRLHIENAKAMGEMKGMLKASLPALTKRMDRHDDRLEKQEILCAGQRAKVGGGKGEKGNGTRRVVALVTGVAAGVAGALIGLWRVVEHILK